MVNRIVIIIYILVFMLPITVYGAGKEEDKFITEKINKLYGTWKIIEYRCFTNDSAWNNCDEKDANNVGKLVEISDLALSGYKKYDYNKELPFGGNRVYISYEIIASTINSDELDNGTVQFESYSDAPGEMIKGEYKEVLEKYSSDPKNIIRARYLLYGARYLDKGYEIGSVFEVLTENQFLLMDGKYVVERVK